jgi:glucan phosphoethanolaminetransferase (alkaline phosphatase superfamily)
MIAEYDNSIEYTDRVIHQILAELKQWKGLSALLYVSDHGLNLYDDERGLFGAMHNNEYDMPTAAFLWVSDAYAARYPEKIAAARANALKPVNTRAMFSTLVDLGFLDIPDMEAERAARSLFSNGFQVLPRMFMKHGKVSDLDEFFAQASGPGARPPAVHAAD